MRFGRPSEVIRGTLEGQEGDEDAALSYYGFRKARLVILRRVRFRREESLRAP